MEVLSSSSHFSSPLSSPERPPSPFRGVLFRRRNSRTSGSSSSTTQDSSDRLVADRHARSPRSTIEQRPFKRLSTMCSFLPLPSITASPICTPTSSFSSPHVVPDAGEPEQVLSSMNHHQGIDTLPKSSVRTLFSPPTWIATPPTPPARLVRRSVTWMSNRRNSPVPPSASFPASTSPHGPRRSNNKLRRSSSVPAMLYRTSYISDPFAVATNQVGAYPRAALSTSLVNMDYPVGVKPSREALELRTTHLFHISHDGEDGNKRHGEESETYVDEDGSPDGSWSDHSPDDASSTHTLKDVTRKYHAMKELLTTEIGYLADLKVLVTIYLRNLPSVSCRSPSSSSTFGRASATFTSGPWTHSYTQLQAVALSSTTTLPDAHATQFPAREHAKPSAKYLFSESEIEILTRNAEELLLLHEQFVRELRALLGPLGFVIDHPNFDKIDEQGIKVLDAAIRAVSTKFATESSRFSAYQSFCAGHPEALDLVRKAKQQHPLEWDLFEQHCSALVSEMLNPASAPNSAVPTPSKTLNGDDRRRALSLTSLDSAVRCLRPRASVIDTFNFSPVEPHKENFGRRIAFLDYMIKPIQRICKYPLLLDQLKPHHSVYPELRSDIDVVVESAAQAMRHVATSVDEARHRQGIAIQSSLILSRFHLPSASIQVHASLQPITYQFLSSLGNCSLAGSLDVSQHPAEKPVGTANVKVKYFGAFLYPGGYLLLVKVHNVRKYEPRHWFSLAEFDLTDLEDDVLLPCSFRLSSEDYVYEFTTACQREKEVWLSAIRESLTHSATWINEPTPSHEIGLKGTFISSPPIDEPDVLGALPTIQSVPELTNNSDAELSEAVHTLFRPDAKQRRKLTKQDTLIKQDRPAPSRRSSTTSVKAIFYPMGSNAETISIRRATPSARLEVDQGLLDVISELCLTARTYACSHEQELFQGPKNIAPTGFARSNSGISMARLSKHESVRVPRRKSPADFKDDFRRGDADREVSLKRSRNTMNLSITSISAKDLEDKQMMMTTPWSSPPSSHSSTRTSPVMGNNGSPPSPSRHRSIVRNVRGFFQFRPSSPSSMHAPPSTSREFEDPRAISPSMLRRWTKGSLRHRSQSTPEQSDDGSSSDKGAPRLTIPPITSFMNDLASTK